MSRQRPIKNAGGCERTNEEVASLIAGQKMDSVTLECKSTVIRRFVRVPGETTLQCFIVPPSTTSVCPVMKAESSLAKKRTAPKTSAGIAIQGMACDAMVCATTSGASRSTITVPSVRVKLGATQLTLTPSAPTSAASDGEKPNIALHSYTNPYTSFAPLTVMLR